MFYSFGEGIDLGESKPLNLSAEKPLLTHDLTIPKGKTIQLFSEMDEATVNLRLRYQSPDGNHHSWEIRRDKDGLFLIKGINFDVAGTII